MNYLLVFLVALSFSHKIYGNNATTNICDYQQILNVIKEDNKNINRSCYIKLGNKVTFHQNYNSNKESYLDFYFKTCIKKFDSQYEKLRKNKTKGDLTLFKNSYKSVFVSYDPLNKIVPRPHRCRVGTAIKKTFESEFLGNDTSIIEKCYAAFDVLKEIEEKKNLETGVHQLITLDISYQRAKSTVIGKNSEYDSLIASACEDMKKSGELSQKNKEIFLHKDISLFEYLQKEFIDENNGADTLFNNVSNQE